MANPTHNRYSADGGVFTHPEKGTKHRVGPSTYDRDYGGYYHTVYHQNGKTPIGAVEYDHRHRLAHRADQPLWMAHRAEGKAKSFTKYMGHHATPDAAIKAVIDNKQPGDVTEGYQGDRSWHKATKHIRDMGKAVDKYQAACHHPEHETRTIFTKTGALSRTAKYCTKCNKELTEARRSDLKDLAGDPDASDIAAVVRHARERQAQAGSPPPSWLRKKAAESKMRIGREQTDHKASGFLSYHIPEKEVGHTHHWLVTGGYDHEGNTPQHTLTGTHEDIQAHLKDIASKPLNDASDMYEHGHSHGKDNYHAYRLKSNGRPEHRYHIRGVEAND